MSKRTGSQAARPGPARFGSPPDARGRQDEHHGHDGQPEDDHDTGLDAYVARLVDAAPPLTSEQRDTLALILHRSRRSDTALDAISGHFRVTVTAAGPDRGTHPCRLLSEAATRRVSLYDSR